MKKGRERDLLLVHKGVDGTVHFPYVIGARDAVLAVPQGENSVVVVKTVLQLFPGHDIESTTR